MIGMYPGRFDGQVALVTGVGRVGQVGDMIARALGERGARLVLSDVNAVAVAGRVAEYRAGGIVAHAAAGDLTLPDVAHLAVTTAREAYGRLDLVVNVAGGLTTWGPFANVAPAGLARELAINLTTAFIVSQAAAPLLATSRGAIVNFASIAVLEPAANLSAYAAAKGAVAALTTALAVELAPMVRVNAVAPGMVRTPDNLASAGADAQYVEPGALVDAVLALAGDRTATGQVVPVRPQG